MVCLFFVIFVYIYVWAMYGTIYLNIFLMMNRMGCMQDVWIMYGTKRMGHVWHNCFQIRLTDIIKSLFTV